MNLFAYLLLLSLFYVILCVNGSDKRKKKKKKDKIIRDGTLNSLVKVLHDKSDIFQKWNYSRAASNRPQMGYFNLVRALTPWIIGEPSAPLISNSPSIGIIIDETNVNCANPVYGSVLDGTKRSKPRVIIDLIPFGYDIDKLELRLLENYDIVDVFIVYESGVTLVGGPKPLFFNLVRNSKRFAKFKYKILYLCSTARELRDKIPPVGSKRNKYWPLSETMRSKPLKLVMRLDQQINTWRAYLESNGTTGGPGSLRRDKNNKVQTSSRIPLYLQNTDLDRLQELRNIILAGRNDGALMIQADADEIATRKALAHLKYCNGKEEEKFPIFLPATMYRTNIHWLAMVGDIKQCKNFEAVMDESGGYSTGAAGGIMNRTSNSPLAQSLWITGPRLWPVANIFRAVHTLRLTSKFICNNHMGISAAVHLSSIVEPAEIIMKESSVIEGSNSDVTTVFIKTAAEKSLTSSQIFKEFVRPRCGGRMHVSRVSEAERAVLENSLPIALKMHPDRYPFIAPARARPDIAGIFKDVSDPKWTRRCNKQMFEKSGKASDNKK